jgi:uncharacterized protein
MTDMETAEALYEAFDAHDGKALMALLHPDFRGDVTPGMPNGWGGVYSGSETMVRECWARVFGELDIRPVPEELLPTADGRIVVLGTYRGTARATGNELAAVFAHVLAFRDGQVSVITQITDSARWHEALHGPTVSETPSNEHETGSAQSRSSTSGNGA